MILKIIIIFSSSGYGDYFLPVQVSEELKYEGIIFPSPASVEPTSSCSGNFNARILRHLPVLYPPLRKTAGHHRPKIE